MSATPADDAQTSPAWNCGCKGSELFWIVQINGDFFAIYWFSGRRFAPTV